MTSFLILSNHHNLLPLAQRLRSEGHETDVIIWNSRRSSRYERAWEGVGPKLKFGGQANAEKLVRGLVDLAEDGAAVVVSDSHLATKRFHSAKYLYGGPHPEGPLPTSGLRLGGWFDGERLSAAHLLVVDRGAWHGGFGPEVDGALTLVRLDTEPARSLYDRLWAPMQDALKSSGFRGLVQSDLVVATADGEPRLEGLHRGWTPLQWHAFVGDDLAASLVGGEPVLETKYSVALPLSIPPWPNSTAHPREPVAIGGLTAEQRACVWWHDIRVTEGQLTTAGLDGLAGVIQGRADTLTLARERALEIAGRVDLPERQLRTDVGWSVETVLGRIEDALGLVL